MNDINAKLVESLDKVQSWVNTTESFVKEQAPLVVQEILQWGQAKYMLGICASSFMLALAIIAFVKILKHVNQHTEDFPMFVFWGIPTSMIISWFGYTVYNYLFVVCAPRLYILEQLGHIIR
jgi:hypothetical protein